MSIIRSGTSSAGNLYLLSPRMYRVVIAILIATEMSSAIPLFGHRAVGHQRPCHSVQPIMLPIGQIVLRAVTHQNNIYPSISGPTFGCIVGRHRICFTKSLRIKEIGVHPL